MFMYKMSVSTVYSISYLSTTNGQRFNGKVTCSIVGKIICVHGDDLVEFI